METIIFVEVITLRYISLSILILTVAVLYLTFFQVPPVEGLGYLARIIFFHIPMAWVSVIAFIIGAYFSFKYLKTKNLKYDSLSSRSLKIGLVFVLLATFSGAIFSKLTWGAYWNWDPRQTTIFILILLYGAYLTLRSAVPEEIKRAKISAIYSLFSVVAVPFLMFIIPRLYFSLHPSPILNESGTINMETSILATLILAVTDATLIYIKLLCYGDKNNA